MIHSILCTHNPKSEKLRPNSIFQKIHEAKKDTQYGEQFCSTQVESVQLGKTTDLTFKFLVSPRDRVKCGGLV